jgi:hypothetical protein
MTTKTPARLAVESAAALAACTADGPDKALIEQVIRTRTEGGRLPSFKILPPLAQVAVAILDGDGTTDAAQFWRERATAAQLRLCHACGYWLNDVEWVFDPCAADEDGTHRMAD